MPILAALVYFAVLKVALWTKAERPALAFHRLPL
jgi:hypothetical protein